MRHVCGLKEETRLGHVRQLLLVPSAARCSRLAWAGGGDWFGGRPTYMKSTRIPLQCEVCRAVCSPPTQTALPPVLSLAVHMERR